MDLDRRKLLESAQRFLRKGQIRKAISDYEQLVADDPKNIRIRSKLADLYARNNDVDRAANEYVQLAKQYEAEDLNYRAISMFKKVLTIRPQRVDVHYWLADLYRKEGLFGNAKGLYHNIIKMNPADEVARKTISEIDETMAGTRELHRDTDLSSLEQADPLDLTTDLMTDDEQSTRESSPDDEFFEIELPPDGDTHEAEEIIDLEEPLDSPADNTEASSPNRAATENNPYLTHQKVDLDQKVSPEKDMESHYHLGVAYMEMDLIDEAIPEFEAALGYTPKRVDCLVMLGQCYMQKGLSDRSIEYLEKASQMAGLTGEDYVRIHNALGKAYRANGREKDATEAFRRAGLKTIQSAESSG